MSEVLSVKRRGHRFTFFVTEGKLEYTIDNSERFKARGLKDGKVMFLGNQEIVINNEIKTVNALNLNETDYALLLSAYNRAKEEYKRGNDSLRDYSVKYLSREELFQRMDKWQKKIGFYKNSKGAMSKYVHHTITIGAEIYNMMERELEGFGVVINPDYKISDTDDRITENGGYADERDEVVVWRYYFQDNQKSQVNPQYNKGHWEDVRILTYNETVCYMLIKRYGVFSKSGKANNEIDALTKESNTAKGFKPKIIKEKKHAKAKK